MQSYMVNINIQNKMIKNIDAMVLLKSHKSRSILMYLKKPGSVIFYLLYLVLVLFYFTPTNTACLSLYVTFGLIFLLLAIQLNLKNKWIFAAAPFLIVFLSVFFGALVQYFGKTPHFITYGLLRGPNLYQPKYRIQTISSGCITNGSEDITQSIHNLTFLALYKVFGPAPHAYQGKFPAQEEARMIFSKTKKQGLWQKGLLIFDQEQAKKVILESRQIFPSADFKTNYFYYAGLDQNSILLKNHGRLYLVDFKLKQIIYAYDIN